MNTTKVLLLLFVVLQISMCLPWISNKEKSPIVANTSCTEDCCKSLASRSPMTYYFYQNTGRFRGGSGAWAINNLAYSGTGKGYLNPDMQCVVNTGPLPATTYKIGYCQNTMHSPPVQRPCAFYLAPVKPS